MTYALIVTTDDGQRGHRHLNQSDVTAAYLDGEARFMSALPHVARIDVERCDHTHDLATHFVIEASYVDGKPVA